MSRTDETPQQLFERALKLEPKWAAVLVAEGFATLEEVAYIPIDAAWFPSRLARRRQVKANAIPLRVLVSARFV